jgi:tetratricopeptide (TPR) repeat protein
MSRSLTLPSVALALCLGACASQPVAPAAAVAPTANAPAAITADADASPYGLFLAGRAARDEGRMVAASDFLSRAATLEGEPAYLQVKAFSAALLAGDIPQAAALAPQASADDDDQAIANQRLGVLVQGVEAMAEDHNKQAYALLTGPGVGYPHRSAAVLVAAWAAAAAGDGVSATAHADLGADVVAQFVGELDRAQLLDRFGKPDLAEAAYRQLLANGDGGGLISAAYGAFLERRGRSKDAEDIYRAALAQTPEETTFADAAARAARHGRAPPRTPIRQGAAEALIVCAAGLMAQKQEEVALDYLRLALRLDPDNDEAWVLVGDLLSSSGDEEGARDAYAHPPRASSPGATPTTARATPPWRSPARR